ncbi:MAG TPA: hypothetical protein HA356_06005 [Candidatus Poseidoniaceae archaeon]|nr:hypothetical protein [Candidatus Poseidoniaceae archaeon]|tara:strand:+ start:1376 stop:2440 length:1065 start_codon:yes stop_codon:yes gene_type:complete
MDRTEGTEHHENKVLNELRAEFSCTHGTIVDGAVRQWILWNTTDLYAWWHSFEDQCQTPLGRKLMNACADQEEYMLKTDNLLPNGWFRRAKRQQDHLDHRWKKYGWGRYSVAQQTAQSLVFAPMVSGIALATNELLHDRRQKIEWHQLSQNTIRFELKPDANVLPTAPPPPSLAWSRPAEVGFSSPPIFDELAHEGAGLTIGGETVCLFPADAFTRLFHTCRAYPNSVSQERKDAWQTPDLDDGERSVLLMVVASMASLVNNGERPIYIESQASWDPLIQHYLAANGWGQPSSVEALGSKHGVRFTLPAGSTFPFLVGWLVAMWERGHGKASKFTLVSKEDCWRLEVDSRLAYN